MNARPEEVLFIDDTQANLDSASALGFKTLSYNCQNESLQYSINQFLSDSFEY